MDTNTPWLNLERFDPYVKLELDSRGENLFMNDNQISLSELNDIRITSLVHEYHVFYADLGRYIVKALRQPETMRKDESGTRRMKMDESGTRRMVKIIKDISCFAASVPSPIAVYTFLVFAPTCVGMIIADAVMEV
jgi:hypothetical protein